jgi:hypothetical protein
MSLDLCGQGSKPPAAGGVELAGARRWVRSLLVMPGLFVAVVAICAASGATDWPVILTVMSALTVIFEALLLCNGVTSLVVSPRGVVWRNRRHTKTVRAEDVSDIFIRHTTNGPVMAIADGPTKIGLSLRSVYRKPMAREALAGFLRRAGVDLPSLRGLGLPAPVLAPRTVAGPILSRPTWPARGPQARGSGRTGQPDKDNFEYFFDHFGGVGSPTDNAADVGGRRRPSVRVGGRALTWVTFAALALTAAVGLLRLFS